MKNEQTSSAPTGVWLAEHALTLEEQSTLAGLIRGVNNAERVQELMANFSSELALLVPAESIYATAQAKDGSTAQQLKKLDHQPQDLEKQSLEQVAKQASKLLSQLDALTASAHIRLRSFARDAHLSPEMLESEQVGDLERLLFVRFCMSMLQDLEAIATKASNDIEPSRTHRLSQLRSRQVVRTFAYSYYRIAGRLPPRNKGCWTLKFMAELGPMVNASLGLHVVRTTILDVEKELTPPKIRA